MAKGDIISDVFEYVRNNRGKLVTLEDIRRSTGFNTIQVQQAMRQIKSKDLWPITTYISGRTWRLGVSEDHAFPVVRDNGDQPHVHPNPEPDPEPKPDPEPEPDPEPGNFGPWPDTTNTIDQAEHLFEYLGARPGGKILLRRDDGLLYSATLEQL